jgi:ABC-type multidrug transport system fused ATPase/permease subunit
MSGIIDGYITRGIIDSFHTIIAVYFALFLIATLVNFIGNYMFRLMGENAVYELRKDTYTKIQDLSLDYFDETPTGDTLSRMTNDLDLMQPILSGQAVYAVYSLFFIVGMLGVLITISPVLTFLITVSIPIIIIILYANNKWARPLRLKANEKLAKVSATMTENIMGARVSTSFAREDYNIEDFKKVNDDYKDQFLHYYKIGVFLHPFFLLYNYIVIFLVLFFGSLIIISGVNVGLTVGAFYLFILYVRRFSGPVITLSSIYGQVQTALASFERIIALHDRVSSVPVNPDAKSLKCIDGEVQFKDVTFAYKTSQGNVLEGFNLLVRPNESVAIVGATGSGKTTIAYLLSRLYDIQEGKILIDGQDVRDVTKESLKQVICMVPQEPFLFSESIRYNLCYGGDCTDGELIDHLELIGADFVFNLSDKLDTVVGERGSRLSLGQRQMITFTRALIPDPKILILDEATSSVDPQTEIQIQRALKKMLQNRTSIIIAHRLSTVRDADRIIVLDKGRTVEEGTFDELVSKKGYFQELYSLMVDDRVKTASSITR